MCPDEPGREAPDLDSVATWDSLVEAVSPASLLVVIESRMSGILRARLSAEDVLQDALLEAWRDRASFTWKGPKSFRRWLVAIVENRLRDAAAFEGADKRGGGTLPVPLDAAARAMSDGSGSSSGFIPPASTTPSRIAVYGEEKRAMLAALESLPDDLREVVRLRLFEQQSLPEIAERLGIGFAAAGHRFRKGTEFYRRLLRAALTSRSARPVPPDSPPESARENE